MGWKRGSFVWIFDWFKKKIVDFFLGLGVVLILCYGGIGTGIGVGRF